MSFTATDNDVKLVSDMADGLVGSEIIKLAGEVKAKIAAGEKIFNLTIGDFDPEVFPIPEALEEEIISAYKNKLTSYPMANGMLELRQAISGFIKEKGGLDYSADEILVSGGARPLIYATYQAILNEGEKALFPIPSWNNNHYSHLTGVNAQIIETLPENNFMPTVDQLKPHISDASMVAVCSPLNPTGTTFSEKDLSEICELILAENKERKGKRKPVYLLFDQIYWLLTYNGIKHFNPVELYPEMKEYTISIDGASKAFCATGIRVGWAFGPKFIMDKMKALLSHVGAWSPKPEQMAFAKYLGRKEEVNKFLDKNIERLQSRLNGFYDGFISMKNDGLPVDTISPQGAIYLTLKFDLVGKQTPEGKILERTEDITRYLLERAKVAIVPFYAFGTERSSTWYRLSVGTTTEEDVKGALSNIRAALEELK
ncbi:MAG: aspartate aminotransferase [Gammaproteobacteria bacterium]|jgi:aspartate aminotransferase